MKFEKTGNKGNMTYGGSQLEYSFVRSFPRSITSVPVSYDGSSLLKVSVQMTYLRYVMHKYPGSASTVSANPFDQAQFNANGFLSQLSANLVDSVVDQVTGVDFIGNVAGNIAGQYTSQQLAGTGVGFLQP